MADAAGARHRTADGDLHVGFAVVAESDTGRAPCTVDAIGIHRRAAYQRQA